MIQSEGEIARTIRVKRVCDRLVTEEERNYVRAIVQVQQSDWKDK